MEQIRSLLCENRALWYDVDTSARENGAVREVRTHRKGQDMTAGQRQRTLR